MINVILILGILGILVYILVKSCNSNPIVAQSPMVPATSQGGCENNYIYNDYNDVIPNELCEMQCHYNSGNDSCCRKHCTLVNGKFTNCKTEEHGVIYNCRL
jgi:hypothetical protein